MKDIIYISDSFLDKFLDILNTEGKFVPILFFRTKNRPDFLNIINLDSVSDKAIRKAMYFEDLGNTVRDGSYFKGLEGLEYSNPNQTEKDENTSEYWEGKIEPRLDEVIEACLIVEGWKIKWSNVPNETDIPRSKEKLPDGVMVSYKSSEDYIKSKTYPLIKSSEDKIILGEPTSNKYTSDWQPEILMPLLFNPNPE